jgi:signal transduction histidine kinase
MEPELSAAAQRHIRAMLRAVAPAAERLETAFRDAGLMRDAQGARLDALVDVTPVGAVRQRTLAAFFRHVEARGRDLARLNTPPPEATAFLAECNTLLESELEGRFSPAREQLQLATVMVLNRAFYDVRESEARCFFGLFRAETEAQDLDGLLARFVRILVQAFGARTGRLLMCSGEGELPSDEPAYLAGDEAPSGCGCGWSYPIGRVALLQLGFAAPRRWMPREESLLRAAGKRFREAFDRVRVQGELRRLNAKARQAEEEERRRIARDLHDEAGQSLLLLRLELELIGREIPLPLRGRLAAARQVAERTIEELRRIVTALSPAVLERLGLEAALRQLAARFGKLHPAVVHMLISLPEAGLSPELERVIYRVAQESLQNISKHSRATRVNFSVKFTDTVIRLRVTDNGAGFCAEEAKNKPMSFGLGGMRERAALLGGTLRIRSAPGKGTAVTLEIPYSAPVTSNGKDSHTHH